MNWISETDISEVSEQQEIVEGEILSEIFRPAEASEQPKETEEIREGIIGNPEKDMEYWHMQEHPMSCAVAVQEFVAEGLLEKDFSEAKMCAYAQNKEWFSETGTPAPHVGRLLEAMGLDVTREFGGTVNDIAETLKSNGKVIVGVNNMILGDIRYSALPGMNANHVVEVIGLDVRDSKNIEVILNDSGVPNGAGRRVPLETFQAAWKAGNCFMASVYRK